MSSQSELNTPVIKVSSFQWTYQSSCLPLHLWTETDPVSETLCSLAFGVPDDRQSRK
jgi:hypothetical protein